MPVPILENNNGSTLISSTSNVSAISAGVVTGLYTVPAGKVLSLKDISIKVSTSSGVITASPFLSIGSNATSYDNALFSTQMSGAVTAGRVFQQPIFGALPLFIAGETIRVLVVSPAVGATALTYSIDLYGDLT